MNTIDTYCDACNQRAVSRIVFPDGLDLILCQHHTNKSKGALPPNVTVELLDGVETAAPVG